ncbi:benzoate/H(+) symporter BenE family transporter [Nocardioides perillae]|uniref:Putative benzoate:H+ symporter BenE n=1 Tax=Nocardioides perillae TaxID=1119534 RepID=A0A7Y9RT79_9ACTN|nr:putative benzoate:H+ symporter BenE [Nocardioides perillae]
MAAASGVLAAAVVAAPAGVVESAAGLALLGTLAASLREALEEEAERVPAVVCLLVAASGGAVLGIGTAFWALVAGLLVRGVLRAGRPTDGRAGRRG